MDHILVTPRGSELQTFYIKYSNLTHYAIRPTGLIRFAVTEFATLIDEWLI